MKRKRLNKLYTNRFVYFKMYSEHKKRFSMKRKKIDYFYQESNRKNIQIAGGTLFTDI